MEETFSVNVPLFAGDIAPMDNIETLQLPEPVASKPRRRRSSVGRYIESLLSKEQKDTPSDTGNPEIPRTDFTRRRSIGNQHLPQAAMDRLQLEREPSRGREDQWLAQIDIDPIKENHSLAKKIKKAFSINKHSDDIPSTQSSQTMDSRTISKGPQSPVDEPMSAGDGTGDPPVSQKRRSSLARFIDKFTKTASESETIAGSVPSVPSAIPQIETDSLSRSSSKNEQDLSRTSQYSNDFVPRISDTFRRRSSYAGQQSNPRKSSTESPSSVPTSFFHSQGNTLAKQNSAENSLKYGISADSKELGPDSSAESGELTNSQDKNARISRKMSPSTLFKQLELARESIAVPTSSNIDTVDPNVSVLGNLPHFTPSHRNSFILSLNANIPLDNPSPPESTQTPILSGTNSQSSFRSNSTHSDTSNYSNSSASSQGSYTEPKRFTRRRSSTLINRLRVKVGLKPHVEGSEVDQIKEVESPVSEEQVDKNVRKSVLKPPSARFKVDKTVMMPKFDLKKSKLKDFTNAVPDVELEMPLRNCRISFREEVEIIPEKELTLFQKVKYSFMV